MITVEQVAVNLAAVRERIKNVGGQHAVDNVSIIAVTKTLPIEVARLAADVGCNALGENYAQELLDKYTNEQPLPIHFIGHLQSNKVKQIAPLVVLWQTVDRKSIAKEIRKHSPRAKVLLQVNVSGESHKSGCGPQEMPALLDHCVAEGLVVLGLMTMAPLQGGLVAAGNTFRSLRRLADHYGLADCSMGMSGDFEVAVSEGATIIRLGSVLFGQRLD